MPICPNCSYALVLLQHRNKYKCALCGKLFLQKEIAEREFREKNKRQRVLDIENYERELKMEKAQLRIMRKYIKYLFNGIPEYLKEQKKGYYKKNKEKVKQKSRELRLKNREYDLKRKKEYYQKNKQVINLKAKLRRRSNLEVHNQRKKAWRDKNLETMRLYGMIQHYRRKQKALALRYLKNDEYRASTAEIFHSVPTYSLSYLLVMKKSFIKL